MSYACCYVEDKRESYSPPHINVFTVEMKRIGFTSGGMYSHVIELDPEREYMVGIDQSTNSTGISVATENFDFVVVMTLIAGDKTILGREMFVDEWLEFLYQMLLGKQFRYVSYESVPPVKGCGSRNTWRVLTELRSRLMLKLDTIPSIRSLPKNRRISVLPQQWKSTIYDKKSTAGKHFNDKAELAKDICKIYPSLDAYRRELTKTYGHDFDGFDSFGILTHARLKHFGPEWEVMNKETLLQQGLIYVIQRYVTEGEEVENFLTYFAAWSSLPRPDGTVIDAVDAVNWNPDVSAYGNLVMMANHDKIIITECKNSKMILAYLVESGEKYDKSKGLWVAVCKGNGAFIHESHLKVLKECGFLIHKYYRRLLGDGITR